MLSRSVWDALRPYGPVVSVLNPLQPHGLLSFRLLCPWGFFLGKNTGVGCHFLLQGIFLTQDGTESPAFHALQADSPQPLGKP